MSSTTNICSENVMFAKISCPTVHHTLMKVSNSYGYKGAMVHILCSRHCRTEPDRQCGIPDCIRKEISV